MKILAIAALTLLWTSGAVPVRAEDAAAPAMAPVIPPLTDETLKKMLTDMGYEPKPLSKGFLIAVKEGTWTLNTQLVLSSNGTKLGLNANLGSVEDEDAVTAYQWKRLLIQNGDIEPSMFYYDANKKKLYLHLSLDNRGMTAEILRGQISSFLSHIQGTEADWKFTK